MSKPPVTYQQFSKFIENLPDIAFQLQCTEVELKGKTLDECANWYYEAFYSKPAVREKYEIRLRPCSKAIRDILLQLPVSEKKTLTTDAEDGVMLNLDQLGLFVFPVAFATFEKYMKRDKLLNHLVRKHFKDQAQRQAVLASASESHNLLLKYYNTFYIHPGRRKLAKYFFINIPCNLRKQFLQAARPINELAYTTISKQTSNSVVPQTEDAVELLSAESSWSSSDDSQTQADSQEPTNAKEITTDVVMRDTPEFAKRNVESLAVIEPLAKRQRSAKKSVENINDCTRDANKPPVSFKIFSKFIENLSDIAFQVNLCEIECMNKTTDECANWYYESFYSQPDVRKKYEFKLKPCPQVIRDKLLQLPASVEQKELTTVPTHDVAKSDDGIEVNLHGLGRFMFPVTFEFFEQHIDKDKLLPCLARNQIKDKVKREAYLSNAARRLKLLRRYYNTFYIVPNQRSLDKHDFLKVPNAFREKFLLPGKPLDELAHKTIANQVAPDQQRTTDSEASPSTEANNWPPFVSSIVSFEIFEKHIKNLYDIVWQLKLNDPLYESKGFEDCAVAYYLAFYLTPEIRERYAIVFRPCTSRMKKRILGLPSCADVARLEQLQITHPHLAITAQHATQPPAETEASVIDLDGNDSEVESPLKIEAQIKEVDDDVEQQAVNESAEEAEQTDMPMHAVQPAAVVNEPQAPQPSDERILKTVNSVIYEFPVSLLAFKRYINYRSVIKELAHNRVKNKDEAALLLSDQLRKIAIFKGYYNSFYTNKQKRNVCNYNFNAAPAEMRKKLLQLAKPVEEPATKLTEKTTASPTNKQPKETSAQPTTKQPKEIRAELQNVTVEEKNALRVSQPKEKQKVNIISVINLNSVQDLRFRVLKSQSNAPTVNATEPHSSSSATRGTSSNEAIATTTVTSNPNTSRSLICVDFFAESSKEHNMNYLLRCSQGLMRSLWRILAQLSLTEFKMYTSIHQANSIYEDEQLLRRCYEHVVDKGNWPVQLYVKLHLIKPLLRSRGVEYQLSNLEQLSPKVLDWGDLLCFTNFYEIARADYWQRTGTQLRSPSVQTCFQVAEEFYRRCWQHNQWLRQVPEITNEKMKQLCSKAEVHEKLNAALEDSACPATQLDASDIDVCLATPQQQLPDDQVLTNSDQSTQHPHNIEPDSQADQPNTMELPTNIQIKQEPIKFLNDLRFNLTNNSGEEFDCELIGSEEKIVNLDDDEEEKQLSCFRLTSQPETNEAILTATNSNLSQEHSFERLMANIAQLENASDVIASAAVAPAPTPAVPNIITKRPLAPVTQGKKKPRLIKDNVPQLTHGFRALPITVNKDPKNNAVQQKEVQQQLQHLQAQENVLTASQEFAQDDTLMGSSQLQSLLEKHSTQSKQQQQKQ
ncbi:protein telomere ends associated isoform X1 [Drosophila busckii]|uniref:protein telomere ends associated isoform X1 n=1 Tax=Drosophila busckii TaxID=30019 RepID=UPI00083EA860|nr:protein telomere ends associated isoform X1 [Drosophila busckii]